MVDCFSGMPRDLGVFLSTAENQAVVPLTCALVLGRQSKEAQECEASLDYMWPFCKKKKIKG